MFTRACFLLGLLVTAMLLLPLNARVHGAAAPVLVIAGNSFPSNDISLSVLKEAFGGQTVMAHGKRIIPINHPLQSPLRVSFDRTVLGLSPDAVGRFWVDRRIRAEGTPPTTTSTPELAVRVVAALVGAVSYATQGLLSNKVKVLTVDGKPATDPAYPIRQ